MLELGGPCHHPASPLDVTVVLCKQRWGALLGPWKTLPGSGYPLGLEKASQKRRGQADLQAFGRLGFSAHPQPQLNGAAP